jgi:predicted nucleic acid-binding protein
MSPAARACLFDASALVKVYVTEDGSAEVRAMFNRESTKYTTPFCFHETLGVFKMKWLRKELALEEYRKACFSVTAWYGAVTRQLEDDIAFTSYEAMPHLRHLITTYEMDASDAFQIISVKYGFFSPLGPDSKTVFFTADKRLAEIAGLEGLKVIYTFDPQPGA